MMETTVIPDKNKCGMDGNESIIRMETRCGTDENECDI